uniref:Uncharacterized protein n=1 Tax=Romanomermis culicivorax TaxID=13658 RepID=A0A915IIN4_ROMCU
MVIKVLREPALATKIFSMQLNLPPGCKSQPGLCKKNLFCIGMGRMHFFDDNAEEKFGVISKMEHLIN